MEGEEFSSLKGSLRWCGQYGLMRCLAETRNRLVSLIDLSQKPPMLTNFDSWKPSFLAVFAGCTWCHLHKLLPRP